MNRYSVLITVDASISVEVEAENEEQAKDLALEKAHRPCICHQCSSKVYVGEIIDAIEAIEI